MEGVSRARSVPLSAGVNYRRGKSESMAIPVVLDGSGGRARNPKASARHVFSRWGQAEGTGISHEGAAPLE